VADVRHCGTNADEAPQRIDMSCGRDASVDRDKLPYRLSQKSGIGASNCLELIGDCYQAETVSDSDICLPGAVTDALAMLRCIEGRLDVPHTEIWGGRSWVEQET
jgi:hypothetical protein